MSTAIVKGILKSDGHLASKIWVAGPHIENLKHWKDLGTNITTKNGEVFNNSNVIFLGVKPDKLHEAVQGIMNGVSADQLNKKILFISMLAGINLEEVERIIQFHLPHTNINVIRIMPNTPMTVGAGACLYTPGTGTTEQQCALVEKLLSSSGLCERVPEYLMDSLGSLTACGPAYMYIVIEALADGAVRQGVPRALALRHAAQLLVGSGQMVLHSGKHPAQLKDEVCSPAGTTIAGVAALENGNLRATLINAVEASVLRCKEMGKK